ncbi:MAG: carboxylating nicotinate-nucleotide diphosphorylase [Candidatus Marinimicrobia bacterium]|nr:carboxylating nicotinate-nucleotide diphosphorylase [Candidatus Neomarinimicrobiota bacterium]MDP6852651.1 carboxylating nicotinate-nucleotide diphosphorylase [Candidatus Neomarinimicrobiota bacterium]MDP6935929.1 carboxylating nicotinate-nucleotide diphosphorylase [Candidatus Neomarinimicrobiota bacterium]
MIEYPQHLHLTAAYIREKIALFLKEDIPDGDKTTQATISGETEISAHIIAVEDLVFAGEKIIPECFGDSCNISNLKKDGALLKKGEIIGLVTGAANTILSRERVMLNLVQRLCGIAFQTRKYVEIAAPNHVKILDTRKTTPGLRLFEKYAVAVGGGYNHRLDLSSGILIKDNHIVAAGSVVKAIQKARSQNQELPLELEVDTLAQIGDALSIGVDGILLDNMERNEIFEAVNLIRNSPRGEEIFIEASGGITLKNLSQYVDTGINAVSVGALTHGVKSKDIRLEFLS